MVLGLERDKIDAEGAFLFDDLTSHFQTISRARD